MHRLRQKGVASIAQKQLQSITPAVLARACTVGIHPIKRNGHLPSFNVEDARVRVPEISDRLFLRLADRHGVRHEIVAVLSA